MNNEDSGIAAFQSEATELLDAMEQALLIMESDPGNPDLIAEVFRAAHTIKGTSGIFSFDEICGFTHVVESVLDRVRAGKLEINSDLIALLLTCKDFIEQLVEIEVSASELDDELNIEKNRLLNSLQIYLGDGEDTRNENNVKTRLTDSSNRADQVNSEKVLDAALVKNDNWHISVLFSENVLRLGMDPLSFLRYLAKLGSFTNILLRISSEVEFETLDPESCYLGIEIDLEADTTKYQIEKVFEFVKEECELHILPPRAKIADYLELIDNMISNEGRIGEMLVRCGALTENELELALQIQSQSKNNPSGSTKNIPMIGEVVVNNRLAHKEVVDAAIEKQKNIKANKTSSSTRTIRIDAEKLDQLVNLVGEMVIAGASTNLIADTLANDQLTEAMSVMSRLVDEIRDSALRLRMVQIGETFNRFNRVVRDVSRELNKNVQLEIIGGETELDKTVVEKIGDPLMHLIRNAMDHGLEEDSERHRAGKTDAGKVGLNAYHDSGSIVIEVKDNGRGLDKDKLFQKAKDKGLIKNDQTLTEQEIFSLIFEPGFSTATQVTNLSGRGVGMDVVRRNIEALRGSVDIESELGVGTTIRIRLPLTLAIIDGFLVGVGDASYVIPLDMIHECMENYDQLVNTANEQAQGYINLRGEVLPLLYLREHFGIRDQFDGRENIVVVQFGNAKIGLVVDQLLGEFQTVIKPLGKIFQRLKGVSGSTILGSGEVAIILDVPGLISQVSLDSMHNSQSIQAA